MPSSLVLVTGAAGNFGRTVVRRLLADGHRVRAFDLPTRANARVLRRLGRDVEVALGDVTDPRIVDAAMKDVDAVAHLAGLIPPASERHPARTQAVNVEGTRNVVRAAEERGSIPFVLTSSYTIYGPDARTRGAAGPGSPVVATDAYTASKLEAEAIVTASSLGWVILRIAASIEGSAGVTDPVVLRLMFEVDPEQPIELVHGEDVATAIARAIVTPEAQRRVLPIGGGPTCQLRQREVVALNLGLLGVPELPASAFGGASFYTCFLDTTESQRILRFQEHDLEAIREDLRARLGPFGPMLRLVSPLIRRFLLRYSGPLRGAPPRPSWKAMIDSGF